MFVLVQNGLAHQLWETLPQLPTSLFVVETYEPVECGWAWDGGSFKPTEVSTFDLIAVKASALTSIDQGAEAARLKFVTGGSAQAMVYIAKEAEAQRCLAAVVPDPMDYPLLTAEIGITGEGVVEVAAKVVESARAWRATAALIETTRLAAKKAVQLATTTTAIDTIFAELQYPSVS